MATPLVPPPAPAGTRISGSGCIPVLPSSSSSSFFLLFLLLCLLLPLLFLFFLLNRLPSSSLDLGAADAGPLASSYPQRPCSQEVPTFPGRRRWSGQPCALSTGSCSAWGNSHFLTFDGTAYSFSGNCTYVLMREIHPGPGDLSLYLNNHYCRATMVPHCARALMLHFKAMDIVLTTTTSPSGRERSLVGPQDADTGWGGRQRRHSPAC